MALPLIVTVIGGFLGSAVERFLDVVVSNLPKILAIGMFVAFVTLSIEAVQDFASAKFLPSLPNNVVCIMDATGLDDALDYFIRILVYGFGAKQIIAYMKMN